jgi:hypothetical protein
MLLVSHHVSAQQLVQNGDFENFSQCPEYVSQIERATGWTRPTEGTSDYLHACNTMPYSVNVPNTQFGEQAAHSGNGYGGILCFSTSSADPYQYGPQRKEGVEHVLQLR